MEIAWLRDEGVLEITLNSYEATERRANQNDRWLVVNFYSLGKRIRFIRYSTRRPYDLTGRTDKPDR